MEKPKAQLPDADPLADLTATERFAQAIERRDALTHERGTGEHGERNTPPAGSTSVTVRPKKDRRALLSSCTGATT